MSEQINHATQGDWRPIPDPTALTDAAISRATGEFRREMDAVRIQLSERIDMTVAMRTSLIEGLKNSLEARLDGMDISVKGQIKVSDQLPEKIRDEIEQLRKLHEVRFGSIALQFSERDVRTDQAATASASALAAALQAAKEAVFEQAQAAAKAAEKTELSFTKQIDQIQLQIKTIGDGFSDRIAELKERIDRGEGSLGGVDASLSRRHSEDEIELTRHGQTIQTISMVIAAVLAILTVVSFVLYVTKK